jgi:hypothetical protein
VVLVLEPLVKLGPSQFLSLETYSPSFKFQKIKKPSKSNFLKIKIHKKSEKLET